MVSRSQKQGGSTARGGTHPLKTRKGEDMSYCRFSSMDFGCDLYCTQKTTVGIVKEETIHEQAGL
jgi:hypothetical protein